MPRSNFVNKKSQENFERITLRRLIQIRDGHAETVEIWLAFLRKHAYYGIGMKANIWEHEKLGERSDFRHEPKFLTKAGVGKTMDISLERLKYVLEPRWIYFGRKKNLSTSEKVVEMLKSERFNHVDNTAAPNMNSILR